MSDAQKLYRRRERRFSAHHMLLRTATRAHANALRSQVGVTYEIAICVVFSALAVEALANALLERLISDWKTLERRAPMNKIKLVAAALRIEVQEAQPPWSDGTWLFELRNQLAHAWPEHLLQEGEITHSEQEGELLDPLQSALERELTFGAAERAVNAAQRIHHTLSFALPVEQRFGILVDGSTSRVQANEA